MKRIVFTLRSHEFGMDGYVREKLTSLETYSEILFSTRKHQNYTGGDLGVRHFILSDCSTLRHVFAQKTEAKEKHPPAQ